MRARHRWTRLALPAVAVALTAAVLAPVLLHRGFVLVYDMVFVPRQPLLPESLGLGTAPPRAVPADAAVALITSVLPGDLLQKLVLVASLLAAALGAARLVPAERTAVRVVAAVGYAWNAYVAERLFIGHWTVLLAYGVLPWIVLAGLAVRRGRPRAWPRLVLLMVPAVLSPTGGLLAAGAAVAAAGRRHALATLGVALVLNAPWLVPSVLHPGGTGSDPAALAARGEHWGGPVLSVLGLGGIWNAEVVPSSRSFPIVPLLAVLVTALALYGWPILARRWGVGPARALLLLGVLGVLIAVAGSVPALDGGLRWAVAHVPGAGLLRDGHRWAAWWALVLAVGAALGVEELTRRIRSALGRGALLAGAALLPIVALPDLAWGGLGRLEPVRYPPDWAAAAEVVAVKPGDVVVLPFMAFRSFEWNDRRVQLDPASRLLPATTVTDDGGTAMTSEDPRAAHVRRVLAGNAPLTELGVRWVLVEHGTPGELPAELGQRTPYLDGPWVSLYELDPAPPPRFATPPRTPVLIADWVALALAGAAVVWLLLPGRRSRQNGSKRPVWPAARASG